MRSQLANPSLVMASNAYRRLHGEWPTWVRFAPHHFAHWATEPRPRNSRALARAFEVRVTETEISPSLTVGGRAGELTYDQHVTDADTDPSRFDAWITGVSERSTHA